MAAEQVTSSHPAEQLTLKVVTIQMPESLVRQARSCTGANIHCNFKRKHADFPELVKVTLLGTHFERKTDMLDHPNACVYN